MSKEVENSLEDRNTSVADGESAQVADSNKPRSPKFGVTRKILFGLIGLVILLGLTTTILVETGTLEDYVRERFESKMNRSGISFTAEDFTLGIFPLRLQLRNAEFDNKISGQRILTIRSADIDLSLSDFFDFRRTRDISVKSVDVDGLEFQLSFDESGRSNLEGVQFTADSELIKVTYKATDVSVRNGRLRVGDQVRDIDFDARGIVLDVTPRKGSRGSIENEISLKTGKSSLRYLDSGLDDISMRLRGVLASDRFEVGEFGIESSSGRLVAKGVIEDFEDPRYEIDVDSSLDVTEITRRLAPKNLLNGEGTVRGKVTGRGTDFKFEGLAETSELKTERFSLRALDLNASYEGRDSQYMVNGNAVAEALTFGGIQVDLPRLAGMIRGTGSDFEWVGELQAVALRTGAGTIGGLFLRDAVLNKSGKDISGGSRKIEFRDFVDGNLAITRIGAADLRFSNTNGTTDITVSNASASGLRTDDLELSEIRSGTISIKDDKAGLQITSPKVTSKKAKVGDLGFGDLEAGQISVSNKDGKTRVLADSLSARTGSLGQFSLEGIKSEGIEAVDDPDGLVVYSRGLQSARIESDAVSLGVVDVAGVRLRIFKGTVEFRTDNPITAGTASIKSSDGSIGGSLASLRAERLIYVVDPSGAYRATADISIGGGSIGKLNLGAATASLEVSPETISVRDLSGNILGGRVKGLAQFSLIEGVKSALSFSFSDVQASEIFALFGNVAPPVTASISGNGEFTFTDNDFTTSTGNLTARSEVTAAIESEKIPILGQLDLISATGIVSFSRARFETRHSLAGLEGSFKLTDLSTDIRLTLGKLPGSSGGNAREINAIVRPLISETEIGQWAESNRFEMGGDVEFSGNLKGPIENPNLNGRVSVSLVALRQKALGAFKTDFGITPDTLEIRDGNITETDGGSLVFSALIPRYGENNIDVAANLNKIDFGSILVLIPYDFPQSINSIDANTSGRLVVSGLPGAMMGTAEINATEVLFGAARFDRVETKARLTESKINFDSLSFGFGDNSLEAVGSYDIVSSAFDFDAKGRQVPLGALYAFIPSGSRIKEIGGNADLNGRFSGRADDTSTFVADFSGTLSNVSLNKAIIGSADISGKTADSKFDLKVTPVMGGSFPSIDGVVDFGTPTLPFTANVRAEKSSLEPIFSLFPFPTEENVKGTVTGSIEISGDLTAAEGEFPLSTLRATALIGQMDVQLPQTSISATRPFNLALKDGVLNLGDRSGVAFAGGGSDLVITGSKAIDELSENNLNLRGRLNLGILNTFLANTILSGVASIDIRITGTNSDEILNGTALLDRSSISTFVSSDRITLDQLNGRINFTSNRVDINSIKGNLGGGKVSISGIATLLDDLRIEKLILNMTGERVRVPFPTNFQTVGNANLRIDTERNGSSLRTLISGRIIPQKALYETDIDLADVTGGRRESAIGQSATASALGDVVLDLSIEGRNALEVRNNLADLTASLSLRITGEVGSPQISGRVTSNSGLIFFRRDRYEIQRAELLFPPGINSDPILNLQAVTEIRGYQVVVGLNGAISDAESLNLSVRSNPSLPQADVISLITTGSLSNTESGIPSVAQSGISTAAEVLTNEIINKPVTRATDKLFGLNRFELDPIISGSRLNPTARLTVGRQINRNLAVTYSTNLSDTQNQVVAFEYRVSNRLSFVAQYEQRELSNVTRQSNNFSFEVRLRRRF